MLKKLTKQGSSTMQDLSDYLKVSRETVRKELVPLEKAG
ncbi:MAG: DeoR family transcriptional regulator, partial [Sphaerochaetaceae bacterium]